MTKHPESLEAVATVENPLAEIVAAAPGRGKTREAVAKIAETVKQAVTIRRPEQCDCTAYRNDFMRGG